MQDKILDFIKGLTIEDIEIIKVKSSCLYTKGNSFCIFSRLDQYNRYKDFFIENLNIHYKELWFDILKETHRKQMFEYLKEYALQQGFKIIKEKI